MAGGSSGVYEGSALCRSEQDWQTAHHVCHIRMHEMGMTAFAPGSNQRPPQGYEFPRILLILHLTPTLESRQRLPLARCNLRQQTCEATHLVCLGESASMTQMTVATVVNACSWRCSSIFVPASAVVFTDAAADAVNSFQSLGPSGQPAAVGGEPRLSLRPGMRTDLGSQSALPAELAAETGRLECVPSVQQQAYTVLL